MKPPQRRHDDYIPPEKSFLLDTDEIQELEKIIMETCGDSREFPGVNLLGNQGPIPWDRIEMAVDNMLADISYRTARLQAIQFAAHKCLRPSFPEVTYDNTEYKDKHGNIITDEGKLAKLRRGVGDFEEREYYKMGFNPYDLSDPLYDPKFVDAFTTHFWERSIPQPRTPPIEVAVGPLYRLYSYKSSGEAVMNQVAGKEHLHTYPFFFPNKTKRAKENFTANNAPLKSTYDQMGPRERFHEEVFRLQETRISFVHGTVTRAWGAKRLVEKEVHI